MPLLPIPYTEIREHSIPREASGLRMDDASVGIVVLLLLVQETVQKSPHLPTSQKRWGECGAI